ncbi:MAG: bifunctional oligoribonuclease/PAP phosphatase NrnA [Candidatus Omnitrophota bacterium]
MSTPKQVWAEIKKHKSFLITTHLNPDADAACSALAMAMVLKKMGKKTVVVNEDQLPAWLTFLPQAKSFHKKTDIKQPVFDAVIMLDCGDLERIGGVSKWIEGKRIINIDHHITNDSCGSVNLILPKASSTCEILFDLFKTSQVKMNKDLALLLYAGIMTDTGSFRYDNTSAKTHKIASEIMGFGLSASDLYHRLYVGIPSEDIKGFVDVIHSAELLFKNTVYCVLLPKKVMDAFSKGFDLKEKIFGFLRSVEGVEVVVILSEMNRHQTRANFRSQRHFDVAKLASLFNGGGHIKASGAKLDVGLDESKKKILAVIKRSL